MAEVKWTKLALDDLKNIVEYISRDSKVYAERFATRVVEAARRLENFPYSGRLVPEFKEENIRELIYGSYRIIYVVRGKICYVTAVVHGSRDILRQLDLGDWDTT
jgi:addiction module RelE/StbE family toxin